jgi:acyl-CoA synthetase (AMP-forming)/AMP-acid ligase II
MEVRDRGQDAAAGLASRSERLHDLLAAQARLRPRDLAFVVLDRSGRETGSVTYADLDRMARAAAAHLLSAAEPGDRVLLMLPTGLDFVIGLFACAYAGMVAIPVPYPGTSAGSGVSRLDRITSDAEPSLAITTPDIAGQSERYGLRTVRAVALAEIPGELASEYRDPGHGTDAIAVLQYTSGSTSDPKGVQVTHRNFTANIAQQEATYLPRLPAGDRLCMVSWLPLFHDMGLAHVVTSVFRGGSVILMPPTAFMLRPALWLETITRFGAHLACAPNFAYDMCAQRVTEDQLTSLDLSTWQVALNGAEPVRADTLERFTRRFRTAGFNPAAFMPSYGLAEATVYVSGKAGVNGHLTISAPAVEHDGVIRPPDEAEQSRQVVSCGPVAAGFDLRIVDPRTHRECLPDQVGEIWLAGESVSPGYWRRPDDDRLGGRLADAQSPGATAEPRYLRTGDLGFRRDGELYVLGRNDDVILVDGRNVYPQDIELTVQQSHRALASGRAAAFAVDSDGGTAIAIAVETGPKVRIADQGANVTGTAGTVQVPVAEDRTEVIRAIRAAVSTEHQIGVARVILLKPGRLPRTTSGKVQRKRCRDLLLAGEFSTW